MRKIIVAGAVAALLGSTGYGVSQTVQSISAKDKAEGAKAHPQLVEEFGGVYAGKQADYVSAVGKKIAVQSGLSNSQRDFTITLLNSPVNNAFAIPGGYVYVTRQLMGLMNDEAELASVLGHETGHVAARHAAKRQSAATRNSILGAIGQVLVGAVAGNSGLGQLLQQGIGTGSQLLTLKFSRSQEYEADDLGIRYLSRAGYDPTASATMLASLNAQTALEARTTGQDANAMPEWASTHPNGPDRVARARKKAQQEAVRQRARNRDAFLNALDGAIYGDDPKQGIVDGRSFKHPQLRIAFTVPQGFTMSNGTRAVAITGTSGQAQFSGGAVPSGGLSAYIETVFRGLTQGQIPNSEVRQTSVGGIPAAYSTARASTSNQQVDVTVFAYAPPGGSSGYHFVTITPAGQGLGAFSSMVQSFRQLNATEAAAIKPRRIQVVTVKAGDTLNSLAGRMAYADYKLDRFLTINGLAANSALRPGQRVKLIVYG